MRDAPRAGTGFFPVSRGWPNEVLAPSDYLELRNFIAEHRQREAPFDLVFLTWIGKEPGRDEELVAAYAEVGVTWWLHETDSLEAARERLRAGPPQ